MVILEVLLLEIKRRGSQWLPLLLLNKYVSPKANISDR
jgi:hypothetical protein